VFDVAALSAAKSFGVALPSIRFGNDSKTDREEPVENSSIQLGVQAAYEVRLRS
jgi:hypothetical protein